jgi:hypothetical protein
MGQCGSASHQLDRLRVQEDEMARPCMYTPDVVVRAKIPNQQSGGGPELKGCPQG